ncbi:hypothetical protein PC9H_008273 [Pleurotus ostreatus]|uniref:Uncharacterized protein n=1 Tax=Pleurotus ostreatus TaxID=5322 RepID=A0A8H7DTJ4_PLEOS|nr:uncharacterized protein PC9H_008273 [Pleurotus ostreatus]KAF7429035.1 hypothetical protein PC9H_008273 [Pleurotus ostreatus]
MRRNSSTAAEEGQGERQYISPSASLNIDAQQPLSIARSRRFAGRIAPTTMARRQPESRQPKSFGEGPDDDDDADYGTTYEGTRSQGRRGKEAKKQKG